jgi:ferredoxin/flavodoxin
VVKVTLIHFSQSGNTRTIAETMAAAFRDAGHGARTVALEVATPGDATAGELVGVGCPCFASQAPTPVKTFLRTLPPLGGQRAFVFATSGAAPGRVLSDLSTLLRGRGAEVVGGFLARGQDHHPAPYLNGLYPGRPDAEDLAAARRFAVAVSEHVAAGRSGPLAEGRADAFAPTERFYNLVGSVSTDAVLRLVEPEPRPDASRCDQCGRCARACPMGNIALAPYPLLGARCIRCYRCLNGCPTEAFDASWRFADPVMRLLYNRAFLRWFGDLRLGERLR